MNRQLYFLLQDYVIKNNVYDDDDKKERVNIRRQNTPSYEVLSMECRKHFLR